MTPVGGVGNQGWEDLDDHALLRAHVAGDTNAFGVLVGRHRDRLWAVALRTLSDREEAADALQEALFSAYRNAASFRGESAVTTWLHRIVVNACLDRVRRRQARPAVPLGDLEVSTTVDDVGRAMTRLDVRAALARLPEAQRTAIVLVDMEDLPVAEVAQLLGVAEGTVKSRCSRGRTALAAMLRDATAADPSGNRDGVPDVALPGSSPSAAPTTRRARRLGLAADGSANTDPGVLTGDQPGATHPTDPGRPSWRR